MNLPSFAESAVAGYQSAHMPSACVKYFNLAIVSIHEIELIRKGILLHWEAMSIHFSKFIQQPHSYPDKKKESLYTANTSDKKLSTLVMTEVGDVSLYSLPTWRVQEQCVGNKEATFQ